MHPDTKPFSCGKVQVSQRTIIVNSMEETLYIINMPSKDTFLATFP